MTPMELLLHRRSVRSYEPQLPPMDLIRQIAEAGTYAPSGKNNQSGLILAVTNPDLRNRLAAINGKIMGQPEGYDPFYGAPAVLVVLAKKDSRHRLYDGSLIMGQLMLAADALGLGSCWIHRARETFESEEGKAILAELGIEDEYEGIGNCIVGYPKGDYPAPKPRKENYVYFVE